MIRRTLLTMTLVLPACAPATSGSSPPPAAATSPAPRAGDVPASAPPPATTTASEPHDAGAPVAPAAEAAVCPNDWLALPPVPSALAIPAGAGAALRLHAAATGTQDYRCQALADGGTGWSFIGPDAELSDCHGRVIGHHFATDAGGPGGPAPEWRIDADRSYVIAAKAGAFTPDGGPKSVPWLLLHVTGESDGGVLGQASYVQRLHTDGGLAPAGACGSHGAVARVPYTADYYFYGR